MLSKIQYKMTEHVASIDLGSNALRLVIVKFNKNELEVVRNERWPLRLGEDVFKNGKIGSKKFIQTENIFIEILHFLMSYNVKNVYAAATSAMREASNGLELQQKIKDYTGISLKIISGVEEAKIIHHAVSFELNLSKYTTVLLDIGGGSTEITVANKFKPIKSKSFDLGTVRLLRFNTLDSLKMEVETSVEKINTFVNNNKLKKIDFLVGTGGNLRRIGKIRKKILGKKSSNMATFEDISSMLAILNRMNSIDKIKKLELDQNKADVILPAIIIVYQMMKCLKIKSILLPQVGLKEGLILEKCKRKPKRFLLSD